MPALIVDTNVLLLHVVGSWRRSFIARFKRTQTFTPEDFDLLARTMARYSSLLVTPSILTEVSNLLGNAHPQMAGAFRTCVESFDERGTAFRAVIADRAFDRLGFADCATALVAAGDVHVLTDDVHLYSELAYRGVSVTNFNHLRSGRMID
jgi:hypothetical protein